MDWLGFGGSAISAGLNFIAGQQNRDAQREFNQRQAENSAAQMKMQEEFAKNSIQWRANDARAAGIHPLYAMGHQGVSYSPVALGGSPEEPGTGLARAGQDLSRAMQATRSGEARVDAFTKTAQDLQLQKSGLENELLATQIAKMRAQIGPPIPSIGSLPPIPEDSKQAERPPLQMGGARWSTDPTTSNMDEYSKRYGDEGLPQWLIPPMIMYRDLLANTGQPAVPRDRSWDQKALELLRKIDNYTRIW